MHMPVSIAMHILSQHAQLGEYSFPKVVLCTLTGLQVAAFEHVSHA